MELCVNDKPIAHPSADDIRQAIDAEPHPEDWYVVLESDDGSFIEANVQPDGRFEVTASDKGRDLAAKAPLEATQLTEILLKFLGGDAAWRAADLWTAVDSEAKEGKRAAASTGSEPPRWALAIVIATIVLVVLTALVLRGGPNSWRDYLPFGHSDYFYVGLIALPFVVLLGVAVLAKALEVRRASSWSTASGRIVKSGTEASHHRFAGEATTVKTVPAVEYEFGVGGRTWRGNRISIGEDSGGANTGATLQRYPVGAVVSVHYDPDNPKNCVLERDVPAGVGKGLAILVLGGAAVVATVYWLSTSAPRLLVTYLPNAEANAGAVIFAASMGLGVLLFAIASLRASRQAAGWPVVRGTVLTSSIEQVKKRTSGRTVTTYAPVVEYGYRVHEVDFVSRQIKLGVIVSASEAYATNIVARYPPGGAVDVHYDPADPGSAALENPTGFHWLLLVVALGLFAVAAYAAGVL